MRWSKYFLPTLKEASIEGDDTPSLRLILQAGMVRQLSSGIYTYLPFGLAVLRNIERVIREEMNATGAVELLMPALQPTSLWKESDRYKLLGKDIVSFMFKDRHDRELLLGPTHEEVIMEVVRREVNSYKQLPLTLYQIQTKFRDEMRPRFGLVRSREFLMKDAYSFDIDEEGLELSYQKMLAAYHRIFKRLGVKYKVTGADSGAMGGKFSEEFVAEGACPELEIGHIFKLGTPYSEKMKGLFLDKTGQQRPYVMGCYGIGVSRLVSAVIENNYDQSGIIWPISVAPFHLLILPINYDDPAVKEAADRLYAAAQEKGITVLMDDRARQAGEKFKDADLTGIPFRVTIGKNLKEGKVELKKRSEPKGELFPPEEVLEVFSKHLANQI
ncbi:MAG: proline--tRNA ligase [Candidatus Omnitrophica bacterium]|nr:proline--tRNA ligase [Candidatus Omnitrophota bacterium]